MNLPDWEVLFKHKLQDMASSSAASDPAHDLLHIQRVVTLTKKLCAATRVSGGSQVHDEIAVPAAWLHDLVNVPKNDPRRSQASQLSATAAERLLFEINYPLEWIPGVCHAIETHSYSAQLQAHSLEAKIVQDADRLDALGAIGIARCFATAGVMRRTFYSDSDPFCRDRTPDDQLFTVDHFYKKLFSIAKTMQTAAGREEAKRRIEFMRTYLAQFADELGCETAQPRGSEP
jgi:uncharacterized protein